MARPADIYLRFLQLAEALRGLPALDPLEERILEFVARMSQKKERLSVRDMMAQSQFGSPATLHARITSMREKGWIVLTDTGDARRKQIELTPGALRYFDKLAEAFAKAANKSGSQE
ncbi:winged helix-turn-helix domain-containing protein [Caballeronia sp. LZ062]|uniref:winged helix-turn-helix domain-containing protein n=1 Tax=unclassified Caballeronia TaxID=2646786 RepID=UPI00285F7D6D|nr:MULTISPECIES: winged helix-turn-helix domain-containing protein [unclassified Caballeronia]MDR5853494.1 winged helix-turn-helix domain-containing protein [Caballeronia sp. LZ050]MDR5871972.1 winged helix-turn-helix domain-containing protein [Caballeronia sp. LZ062]